MCKTMARIATPRFWAAVSEATQQEDAAKAKRALYLLAHGADVQAGARMRRDFYRSLLREKYGRR
jgi:hypothetical protein